MKNKILMRLIIGLILMVMASAFVFSGCTDAPLNDANSTDNNDANSADNSDRHTHSYNTQVVEATCTTDGYTLYTCISCNDMYQEYTTSALGHDYRETQIAETCVAYSHTKHTCSRCGDSYIDNEGATYKKHIGIATCTSCGLNFFDDMRNMIITNGTLDDGEYTMSYKLPSSDSTISYTLSPSYDIAENEIKWNVWIYTSGSPSGLFTILIDTIGNTYIWSLTYIVSSSLTASMGGLLNAATFASGNKLSYLTSNLTGTAYASLNDNLAKIAYSTAKLTVSGVDLILIANNKNYTTENFGFNI